MSVKIRIMLRAVRIRTEAEKAPEAVPAFCPRLTDQENRQIREAL